MKKCNFVSREAFIKEKVMASWLVIVIISICAVGFFVLAMSLTLIIKGHHIESEISTNKDMQRLGIKCAVQEMREDMADDDCEKDACSGNCAGCDIEHTPSNQNNQTK